MNKYYLKLLLFIASVSQLISPYLLNFSGGSNFSTLLITPAGYTFSIWGLITFSCFIFSTYHLFWDKNYFSKSFYSYSIFLYILFSVWLFVAERENILGTMIVFVFIIYSSYIALKESKKGVVEKNFFYKYALPLATSIYLAWVSVAIWANLGVLFLDFGMIKDSLFGVAFQGALVLCATLSAIVLLKEFNKDKFLFATYWWAFVGIIIGAYSRIGFAPLLFWVLLCVVVLNIFYFSKSK